MSQWQPSTKVDKGIVVPSIQDLGRSDGTGILVDERILVGYLNKYIEKYSTLYSVLVFFYLNTSRRIVFGAFDSESNISLKRMHLFNTTIAFYVPKIFTYLIFFKNIKILGNSHDRLTAEEICVGITLIFMHEFLVRA